MEAKITDEQIKEAVESLEAALAKSQSDMQCSKCGKKDCKEHHDESMQGSEGEGEKSLSTSADTEGEDLDKEGVSILKKLVAAVKSLGTSEEAQAGSEQTDDDKLVDDPEFQQYLGTRLEDIDGAGLSDAQKAIEISRWLDNTVDLIKSQHGEIAELKKALEEQRRQIGLLLAHAALELKKSQAAGNQPQGRVSHLSVLDNPVGKSTQLDPANIPSPAEIKRRAVKALAAGKIGADTVALIEAQVNGDPMAGIPPTPPSPEIMAILNEFAGDQRAA